LWSLEAVALPPALHVLRREVRAFLAEETAAGRLAPHCDQWLAWWDPAFSRRLGARGWIGMAFPAAYGGSAAGALARFVVTEELLAAGAPVAAHWIADRQSGPALLRFGTDEQKHAFLPGIARGMCFFAIGMSEPDTGSDLASVRTRGRRVDGGWRLSGTKVWTSGAHLSPGGRPACRAEPVHRRPAGPRRAHPAHPVADRRAPLQRGRARRRVRAGRAGPRLARRGMAPGDKRAGDGAQRPGADLVHLPAARRGRGLPGAGRRARRRRARRREAGASPEVEAAAVKDLGTRFESAVTETVRLLVRVEPDLGSGEPLPRMLAEAVLHGPGFTLRGGTNEILRGVVARALGVR
jgi:acyl-CoA dehydrogenase